MNFQLRCVLLVVGAGLDISNLRNADEKLRWSIQQTLASKKYIDLTHAFELGIARRTRFPDEIRKTIYWYVHTDSIDPGHARQ